MRKYMSQSDPAQPQTQFRQPFLQTQTEWQQPPSQPLPQQPKYQQSYQPQPPKKARNKLWMAIGMFIVLTAIIGGVAISRYANSRPDASAPSASSGHKQQPTRIVNKPTPQPTLVINAIGAAVVVDSTWTITVNSVKTNAGDPFSTPGAGDVYLVVDVTVKNTSSHYQDMLSGNQLVLKDSAGQQYREAITDFATPPDGLIRPDRSVRGQLAYEIPATAHAFFYYFQADANGTDLTEWALNV
jgi:hypothetical protein